MSFQCISSIQEVVMSMEWKKAGVIGGETGFERGILLYLTNAGSSVSADG